MGTTPRYKGPRRSYTAGTARDRFRHRASYAPRAVRTNGFGGEDARAEAEQRLPSKIVYILSWRFIPPVKLEGRLFREPGERPLPAEMLASLPRQRGRPRSEYRPKVRSEADVRRLRRHRVPAVLLTAEWVSRSGYPVAFRPWLVVPERLSDQLASEYRVLPVKDEEALREPGVVELVTWLLRFDPLAARVVASRNRAHLDPHELYRRVRNEGVERPATKIRLQQFAPAIPRVGEPLPASELRWIERNNPAEGVAA